MWRGFTSPLLPLEGLGFWSLASHLAKLWIFQLSLNTWKLLSGVKVVPTVGFTSLDYAFVSTTIFKFFDAFRRSFSVSVSVKFLLLEVFFDTTTAMSSWLLILQGVLLGSFFISCLWLGISHSSKKPWFLIVSAGSFLLDFIWLFSFQESGLNYKFIYSSCSLHWCLQVAFQDSSGIHSCLLLVGLGGDCAMDLLEVWWNRGCFLSVCK